MDAPSHDGILRPVLADVNMDVSMADAQEVVAKGFQSNNNSENLNFGSSCKENCKPDSLVPPVFSQNFLNVTVDNYASDDDTCVSYCNNVLNLTSLAEQFNNLKLETPGRPRRTPDFLSPAVTLASSNLDFKSIPRSDSSNSLYKSFSSVNESGNDLDLSHAGACNGLENGVSVLSSPLKEAPHDVSDTFAEDQNSVCEKLDFTIEPETQAPVEGKSPVSGCQLAESAEINAESEGEHIKNVSSLNGVCEEQPDSISSVDSASENCAVDDSFRTASNPDLASTGNEESTSANNFYSAKSGTDAENQNADETIVLESNAAEVSECSENLEASVCAQEQKCFGTSLSQSPLEEELKEPDDQANRQTEDQPFKAEEQVIKSEDPIFKSEATEKSQEPTSRRPEEASSSFVVQSEEKADKPVEQAVPLEELVGSEAAEKPVEPVGEQSEHASESEEFSNKSEKAEELVAEPEIETTELEEQVAKLEIQAAEREDQVSKPEIQAAELEEQVIKPETQAVKLEQVIKPKVQAVELEQVIKPETQAVKLEEQVIKPEIQAVKLEQVAKPEEQSIQSEELITRLEAAGDSRRSTGEQLEQATESENLVDKSGEEADNPEPSVEPEDQPLETEEQAGKLEESHGSEKKRLSLGVSSYFKANCVDVDKTPSRGSYSSSEDGFNSSKVLTAKKIGNRVSVSSNSSLPAPVATFPVEEKPCSASLSPSKTSSALEVESAVKESANSSKLSVSTCDLEAETLDISAANSVSSKIASPGADGSIHPVENLNSSFPVNPNDNFGTSWHSEAGPVTAAEEIFEDPAAFDFLTQRGNNAVNSNLNKKSLFVKFDPLVPINSPSQIEKQISASLKMADENSGNEKCDVQSKKNPSPMTPLKNPALEAVGKLIEASPTVPGVDSKALEAELAKLQELLIQQEKEFKEKLQKSERNEALLRKELSDRTKNKDKLSTIMNEYEKTISQMVAQKEVWESKLKGVENERDTTMQHLNNLEIAFNDVHQKYERSKAVIESLKQNEDILKASVQEYDVAIKKQENKYEMLKQHAKSQLEKANQELDVRTKSQDAESAKLRALLKKAELKTSSLEQALEQKTKENQELMKICDELINKVGGSS